MPYVVTTETTISDGATTSVDVGIPAGHVANDVCVLFVSQDTGTNAIATPSGFIQIGTQAAVQGQRTTAFYKVLTSNNEPDINISSGLAEEWAVSAVLVRGANTTTPINASVRTDSANSTSNNLVAGSVTTTSNNCLVLVGMGFDGSGKLIVSDPNSCVTLSKLSNLASITQTVHYFNQLTAGATPTLTILSELASEGGNSLTIAIADATPSTPSMSPMTTRAYTVVRRYGGTAASPLFVRHDGTTTWQDVSGNIVPTTLDGIGIIATPTFGEVSFQPTLDSTWGAMAGLSFTGSAIDNTGRWMGRTHTITSTDFSGKIVSIEFQASVVASTTFGEKGMAIYFQDGSGNWRAYTLSRRLLLIAGVTYVAFIDVENTTPLGSGGTMNWSNVVRVGYLSHKRTTATTANVMRVKNLLLHDKVILVDGCDAAPCSPSFLQTLLGGTSPDNSGHGPYLLATLQGSGQTLVRAGLQYGNGTRKTYTKLDATSHELPLRADPSITRRFWKVEDNSLEYRVYASANDTFKANACVIATDTRQDFIVDPLTSTSATYDFSGASIIGYDITNAVITINGAALKNCTALLNGGGLDGCSLVNTLVTTNDPSNITDTSFTSGGTGHAIIITTPGTYTFEGNTFSGYSGTSTNAAIYNNSGGVVTLNILGDDEVPTVRNGAGASTTISTPPIQITANVLANSRVQLYNVTTDQEIANVTEATTSYAFTVTTQASSGDTIRLRVTKKGYLPFETSGVFSLAGLGFVTSQVADTVYNDFGIDGATVTKFSADYVNDRIDIASGSTFTAGEFYAWWSYNMEASSAIASWFGGVTAIDTGNVRINDSVVDLLFDNLTATNVVQTDTGRIFRVDGDYPALTVTTGNGGIQINWKVPVATIAVGSGVTPTDKTDIISGTVAALAPDITKIQNNTNLIPAAL
jgi:hypothetical protein